MELIKLGVEELIKLVKQLPDHEFTKLKHELERKSIDKKKSKNDLKEFLLSAPVFSKEQIQSIKDTRSAINKWRKK